MRDDIHPGPRIISGKAELPSLKPEPWMIQASCATADPDAFFPHKRGDGDTESITVQYQYAKKICRACPVRVECLTYAIVNDERDGIYGGLGPRERAKILRNREAG
ncbi:WhiB family transcriptional regulator [Mycobacteroides abscessus subsp. bolletii 50594]|uniref:Transcriptional regulator WhiB n=1 Tax=Mycobacteroides abscessus subsp. bolletii 50594 TaxID=1303024 RepID=A0AB33A908_9MYCO|nr:WhiB family transcriptional regulator [Mycobacteroides abscessus]AGM28154.1 WhiB family transcriptional regulator [Mycobacteroides abscessus subsp. bolletii 50594]